MRREQQMHMIRHNYPGMHIAIGLATMLDRTADQCGNLRALQINWPEPGGVEQPVHRDEGLPGGHALSWEFAAGRQDSIKAKGHEEWLADGVDVRQAAL